jgi:hypothetical protein
VQLTNKCFLILVDDIYEDLELWYPRLRLIEAGARVTDAGLKNLNRLTRLQSLSLARTNVTDAGLMHIKGLTKLQYLGLWNTKVSGVGLANLKGLSQLRVLELEGNKVSDSAVKNLQQALPNCRIER